MKTRAWRKLEMRISIAMWILAFAMMAGSVASGDEGKDEAQRHFKAGLALFKAEKYEAAALELEASVKLYPTKGGVFNLASVYKVMSRYDEALAALNRLDKEYGAKLDAEMKAAATKMREEIEGMVARLEIIVTAPGAAVLIDGREIGQSPFERRISVDPGEHAVRAVLPSGEFKESKVRVLSGQREKVALVFPGKEKAQKPAATVATAKDGKDDGPEEAVETEPEDVEDVGGEMAGDEPSDGARRKIGPAPLIVAAGVTVGSAVAAVVLGAKAKDEADAAKVAASQSRMDKADSMQKAGQALFGVAIAAGVTAVVLAFFTDFEGEREAAPDSARVELEGVWPVALEGGGVAAVGVRF